MFYATIFIRKIALCFRHMHCLLTILRQRHCYELKYTHPEKRFLQIVQR